MRILIKEKSYSLFLGILISTSLLGCGYSGPIMSVKELKSAIDDPKQKINVIDVRPAIQFNGGHVPGALNFPLEEIETSWKTISSIKGEIAIICTCGRRSLAAIEKLSARGITAALVEGGMKQWDAEGYPKERIN